MTWTYHQQGTLRQWAIEDSKSRHVCLVYDEDDAKRIVNAVNFQVEYLMHEGGPGWSPASEGWSDA